MDQVLYGMSLFGFLENIGTLQIILFAAGLLLLIFEIFTPGFGVAGGAGLILIMAGIFLTARSFVDFLVMFVILLLLVAALLAILLRSSKKGKLRKLILRHSSVQSEGYSATADHSELLGQEGIAATILRPAGTADFGGRKQDVVTEGEFIEKGAKIRVIRTEGRRIVVEKI